MKLLKKIKLQTWLILIVLLIPFAYNYSWRVLTDQSTMYTVIKNQVTINFVLFLWVYGYYIDRYTKGMSKRKKWAIWAALMVLMVLFFKYVGGMETWW